LACDRGPLGRRAGNIVLIGNEFFEYTP
jgi:hypothetical protein